jgi:hypothetical protein
MAELPHYMMRNVEKSTNGCWHWTGTVEQKCGYGIANIGSRRDGTRRRVQAHRHAFEIAVRPLIPRGQPGHLQVDHECHNRSKTCQGGPTCLHRRCVNPAHLAAKSPGENTHASRHTPAAKNRAKTHCERGHPLAEDNLRVDSEGRRHCYTCHLAKGNEARKTRLGKQRGPEWKKVERCSKRTRCPEGHPLSGENLYLVPGTGARQCLTCRRERSRQWYAEHSNGPRELLTHCKRGHPYEGENVYIDPKHPERRACRTCRIESARRSKERRAAAESA